MALNGLEGVVEVRNESVGTGRGGACPAAGAPRWTGLQGSADLHMAELAAALPLDCFIRPLKYVDIVKVHVGHGGELAVLEGLLESLHTRRVGIVIVRSTAPLAEFEAFAARHGLEYIVRGILNDKGRDALLVDSTVFDSTTGF